MTDPARRPYLLAGLMMALVVALLPWWRNHAYLRDLYDYGLVLAANGHLDLGERPYVDFTTPIQAGFLGLNWLIERAGGGTWLALTLGGAGLVVTSALGLILLLARRWPWWAAVAVGASVTVAGASQHTILWHNSLGLFCLALVAWSAACAPVLRRATWPWHAVATAGLVLGGFNKLNFQLVAVAAATAWALRAGLLRQAGWARVAGTIIAILLAGLILPVAGELVWTGASLPLWFDNVVRLAAESRIGNMENILSWDFLLRPVHDYYGPLLIPQAGLAGGLLSLAALVGCWPRPGATGAARLDRWLVPAAVGLAATAAAALLATNFEITCLGLGAWLVLVTSLWLGFAPAGRRAVFIGGLVLPALVLGATAWWSAWIGQRSQFGYSLEPRSAYLPAESAGPAYAGLRGLHLPPDVMLSLELVAQALPEGGPDGPRPVFYAMGLELLHRYYPGAWEQGQPLWIHWGTTYNGTGMQRLADKLARNEHYQTILTTVPYDTWPEPVRSALHHHYIRDLVGPAVARWRRRSGDTVDLTNSLETLTRLGGNVDGRALHLNRYPLGTWPMADGRLLLGTTRPAGQVLLYSPVRRLEGVAMLDRLPRTADEPLVADFKLIIHGASPEQVLWSARVELPAGRQTVSVPFTAEGTGQPLLLWVTRPTDQPASLLAGYRDLVITHVDETDGPAPRLRDEGLAETDVTPALAQGLFGPVGWRPEQLTVRGGTAAAGGLELPPGGEVWLHTAGMNGEIRGEITCPESTGRPPLVRVLWYKGGRLQILQQVWSRRGQPAEFRAWTAEPGGWIGLVVEPGEDAARVLVRATGSTLAP